MLHHERITGWDVRFNYTVLYVGYADKKPHVKTVCACTPAEAKIKVVGYEAVVLFEEPPTEYSEGDHARNH